MRNLIRMDLYRMGKTAGCRVCLLITLILSLIYTPMSRLLYQLAKMFAPSDVQPFMTELPLSGILNSPFPVLGLMLSLLSACYFFYGDLESGYIKNIAGQMPKKGYTVLSKFLCVIPHHLVFMAAGILGNVIGTVFFCRISPDAQVGAALLNLPIRLLLLLAMSALLLLVTVPLRSKSFGLVLAVLMGTGLMFLLYMGVDSGLDRLGVHGFNLESYMPDQLIGAEKPNIARCLAVGAGWIAVLLPLSMYLFDRRDIK